MESEPHLLDTHLLLWAGDDSPQLSAKARAILTDARFELVFSAVSIWEVGIKRALNRPDFQTDPAVLRRALLQHGYRELPLTGSQAFPLTTLPHLHRDPFDRLLIAQAISENLTFVTADKVLARYPGKILLV